MEDRRQQGIAAPTAARAARDHKAGDYVDLTFTDVADDRDLAREHIELVLDLHGKPGEFFVCPECDQKVPCETRRILTGETDARRS